MTPVHGRDPVDTSECPDSTNVCERKSTTGELLLCPFHYELSNFCAANPHLRYDDSFVQLLSEYLRCVDVPTGFVRVQGDGGTWMLMERSQCSEEFLCQYDDHVADLLKRLPPV